MRDFSNKFSKVFAAVTATGILTVTATFLLPRIWPENKPPTAIITINEKTGEAPFTILADGRNSRDPEGQNLRYQWTFNEKHISSELYFTKTIKSAGMHRIVLTVTDPGEKQGKSIVIVNVSLRLKHESQSTIEPSDKRSIPTIKSRQAKNFDAIEIHRKETMISEYDTVVITVEPPLAGLSYVRAKIDGNDVIIINRSELFLTILVPRRDEPQHLTISEGERTLCSHTLVFNKQSQLITCIMTER